MLKFDLRVGGVHSIDDRIFLAQRAESAGLSGVWHGEPASEEAFVPLAAIAMKTSTIDVGSSIVGWTRSLPVMESTASNVQKLAGGRFHLTVGTLVVTMCLQDEFDEASHLQHVQDSMPHRLG